MYNPQANIPKLTSLKKTIMIVVIPVMIFIFNSCHPALKFATVKYDSLAVNKLLNTTAMDHIIFQFSSDEAGSYKNPFLLVAYSFDSLNHLIDTLPYSLQKIEYIKSKSFKEKIILGNLTVSRAVIEDVITDDSTHKKIPFDFLQFVPDRNAGNKHIYYEMSAPSTNVKGERAFSKTKPIQPCPPAICF